MLIQPAELADAPSVMEILALCREEMRVHGIDQWDETYPNLQIVEDDARSRSLFVIREDGRCVGSVCLNDLQPAEYCSVPWRCTGGRALVVHRLCVLPERQRRGVGRRLMEFAEDCARERGFACIRLEVYIGAPRAVALYEHLGYQRVGQVRFPRRRLPFDCFELSIAGTK